MALGGIIHTVNWFVSLVICLFDPLQDAEFQHGASVLAEWLDNDEDGCVDTPEVLLAAILILIRSL